MQKLNSKFKSSIIINFKFLIVILIFEFLILNLPTHVSAQQVTLSISPPILETIIKPGKSILVAYTINNPGDPTLVKASISPFEPLGNTGNIKIKDEFEGPIRFNLDNSDIAFDQPFFLTTGSSKQLLVRMRVPEGAPEGDYYYTVLVETQPPPMLEGEASSRAKVTIGSNILMTVNKSGLVDIKGKISLFDVLPHYRLSLFGKTYKIFDSSDKIPMTLILDNNGSNIIKPTGKITMKGNFGEEAKYEIVPQNILAHSQRLATANPSAETNCGKNSTENYCRQPTTLILSGFFIGYYQLSTTISFGDNATNLYASTSFIGLPIKFALLTLAVIIVSLIIVIKIRKNNDDDEA